MAGIGVALLALLSMPAVADLMVRPLEDMTAPLTTAARVQGQAIVVLAAGRLERAPEYGGADIPDYVALARLRYAARLQHETGLPVLVSGGNAPAGEPDNSKARAMAAALRDDFAAPVRWIEGRSENTEQNALFSAEMLRGAGIHRVLVVTDAMHMPRAMMAFAQTDLQAIAAPTMFFRSTGFDAQALLPSAEGLRRSYYASYEWIGLLWYALRLNPASRT